ncbi:MAG: metal-dependent hydrolase, partial [Herbaspirillum sp.]
EHKCTAFDLYQATGGTLAWRRTWMRRVTWFFLSDTMRQTINNLRHDHTLWRWSTWKSAAGFLFGKRGLVRHTYRPWRAYRLSDFHPSQQPTTLSQHWLQEHAAMYTPVGS